jgi:DNA-binding transcriptional regulator YiaG
MDSPTAQVEALTRVRVMAASGTAKAIRDRARLSQSEMARALGVETSTICRWERGIDRPIGAPALAWLALLGRLQAICGNGRVPVA